MYLYINVKALVFVANMYKYSMYKEIINMHIYFN